MPLEVGTDIYKNSRRVCQLDYLIPIDAILITNYSFNDYVPTFYVFQGTSTHHANQ